MTYRSLALAISALSFAQAVPADAQSVYVAPGGMYVQSAQVFVRPDAYGPPVGVVPGPAYGPPVGVVPGPAYGPPPYVAPSHVYAAPPYVEPAPLYGAPVYGPPVYGEPPVYAEPEPAYVSRARTYAAPFAYARETVVRPPAPVPHVARHRCVITLADGRRAYCD